MLSDRGNNDASKRARRCWISLRCRSRKRTGRLPNAGSRRLTRRCGTARKRRCPGALRLTAIGGTCSASPGILPPLADGTRSFANCWPVHVMPAPPDFGIDAALLAPRRSIVAGCEVIEAVIRFDTANGPGVGAIRLLASPDGEAKAWTISTSLDFDRICAARANDGTADASHTRNFAEADWRERRRERAAWRDGDPDVLVIGGGHTGISAAIEVQRLGYSALVVDREQRIGDNWRLRYRGLKLHNKTPVNHLRYLPFPVTFPEYIPKDQIANWLESYVDIMDVDFWTRASFEGARYEDATQRWGVRLRMGDGTERVLHPRHIVIATSVSGVPSIPMIEGIGNFKGPVLHSSQFKAGREWKGRSVVVFGTGTSAHDICQELEAKRRPRHHGAAQPDHGRQCRTGAALRPHLSGRWPAARSARHHQFRGAAAGDEGGAQAHHDRGEGDRRAAARPAGAGRLSPRIRRGRHRLAAEVSHPRRRLLFQCRGFRTDRRGQDRPDSVRPISPASRPAASD